MKAKKNKGVALIMAIAILSILAVVGFGFATSMKIARDATATIQNLVQARLAADSAIYYVQTMIYEDGIAEPTATAGQLADHSGEAIFTGISKTESWRNLLVGFSTEDMTHYTSTVKLKDELGKMNLHFGNLSKWNYTDVWNDGSAGVAAIVAANQLYSGANHGYSVYEVSLEEFFYQYYKAGYIWNVGQPYPLTTDADKKARLRAANIARAFCLYKYGGKKNIGMSGGAITTFGGDGKPGGSGDDDGNDSLLSSDLIDNDGDGVIDEATEGADEPSEYNPLKTYGDDSKLSSVSEFRDVLAHPFTVGVTVPAAVNYTGSMSQEEIQDEADRLYEIFKDEVSVYCPGPDALSVSIDPVATDGYDNDGDGHIDSADTSGSTTIAGIKAQLDAGTHINKVSINETAIEPSAEAAYLYWKCAQTLVYKTEAGGTTSSALLANFTVQNAVDTIDYRDSDCVPTVIPANAIAVGVPAADTYGFEGLHIGEVGRFICTGSNMTVADGTWAAASGTFTVSVPANENRQSTLRLEDATNMKTGSYLVRCTVSMPAGGSIDFGSGQTAAVNGEVYFGPFTAATNVATITVNAIAGATAGTFQISDVRVILPYIDIMNFSRRARDMSTFQIKIGTGPLTDIIDGNVVEPVGGTWANGEVLAKRYIPRLKSVSTGFDSTNKHGAYYGHFVIAYNQASFDSWFSSMSMGNRDFPICVMPALFEPGFDGKQTVELYQNGVLVAGGVIDRFNANFGAYTAGTGGFTSTSASRCRVSPSGSTQVDAWYDMAASAGGGGTPVTVGPIDNLAGSPQVTITGTWTASTFCTNRWSTNYVHDGNVDKGAKSVRYTPTLPTEGSWEVFFYRPNLAGWATNAPIDIIHKNGTTTYTDNQTINGGAWVSMGTYTFNAGTSGSVLIRTTGTTVHVIADAVKFVSVPSTAASCRPGRWKQLPDTVTDYAKYWPTDAAPYSNEDVHVVTVSDRGYFRSPAEITNIRVSNKYSTTMSLAGIGVTTWDTNQPNITRIVDRLVTGRAPIKVNINTAPEPVMKAALCTPLGVTGYATIAAGKPFTSYAFESGGVKILLGGTISKDNGTDLNEQNNGSDAGERKTFAIIHSNLFTIRSTKFTAKVLGTVCTADMTVVARHANTISYIRGMSLDSSQRPTVAFEKVE